MEIHHETLIFERDFDAPPSQLFSAYIDTKAREQWSTPSPTAEVKIDSSEVRTGGHETGRCGGKGDLRWTLKVIYHLVTPDRQITFTEELWDGEQILTVALITFDLKPIRENKTALTLTDQITSFVGADAVGGHREGYTQALTNLQQHVTKPKSGHSR
ncbi:SRPBCC domain-containing protein [Amaricoccus macauensis]|uniref:SRPBCC domain-containing protein n=1 Tax=Amaricoccus macauensis TaxID=57001 RepID=UPI003C7E1A7B